MFSGPPASPYRVITINAETGNAVECWDLVSNVFRNDGDFIRIDTGNSGGGNPKQRDPTLAPSDQRNGYVTPEQSTDPSSARRRRCGLRRPQ